VAGPEWESEFVEYFSARYAQLRRLGFALSGDWHTAEDLAQATFVQLYRHWRRAHKDSVDAYARRILVNGFLSRVRNSRREDIVAELPDIAMSTGAESDPDIDLGPALASLPPSQRALVVLRYLQDMSVADAAALLGVSEGTVKSQTARGVAKLRSALNATAPTKERI
jgi:RNA polymerase sigma-70 factor (sigma-E family)